MKEHFITVYQKTLNVTRKKKKKTNFNFFNIVFNGRKIIPVGALILADVKNIIIFHWLYTFAKI